MITRSDAIDRLRANERWDLVIIGGGATGLGCAVDAASRGYRTVLFEGHDFAKGTSSRSTKLVHGGVRYLAQGNLGLVREALHERGLLRLNAPHLFRDLSLLVPGYRWLQLPWYGAGLKVYDFLAGRLSLGPSRIVGTDEALRRIPSLRKEGLRGGVVYHDGQFDDSRLAITLLRTFLDLGGTALNYASVTALRHEQNRITGVEVRDEESNQSFSVLSRGVINATGVFAGEVRSQEKTDLRWSIRPSRGVHIVLDRAFLPGETALMIPRTDDGRVLFAIPWHDHVIVGTTDTPVEDVILEPKPSVAEIGYLLDHARRYLDPSPELKDVQSTFAGLRPLVETGHHRRTSTIPREEMLDVSPAGLVTITGGKWTTYRHMAERSIDRVAEATGLERRPCRTSNLRLHGWLPTSSEAPFSPYGSDLELVEELAKSSPGLSERLHPGLPYMAAEVVWAARCEMARTVEDVLARRTRTLFLDARAAHLCAPRVAELLAGTLGKDQQWIDTQVASFRELAERYLPE